MELELELQSFFSRLLIECRRHVFLVALLRLAVLWYSSGVCQSYITKSVPTSMFQYSSDDQPEMYRPSFGRR